MQNNRIGRYAHARDRLTRRGAAHKSLFFAKSKKNRAQPLARPRLKTPHSRQAAAFFELALTMDTSADFMRRLAPYCDSRGEGFGEGGIAYFCRNTIRPLLRS